MEYELLLIGVLFLVSRGNSDVETVRIEWSPAGVKEVNHTVRLKLGDLLILECPPKSFSNLVSLESEEEFNRCNSSLGNSFSRSRGNCLGLEDRSTDLTIQIQSTSASLSAALDFTPGNFHYFASFSDEASLSSSYNSVHSGGECLDGLKLAVYVEALTTEPPDIPDTTTTMPITTHTTTVTEKKVSVSPTTTQGIADPLAEGLMDVSGCVAQCSVQAYSIFVCTLLAASISRLFLYT